MGINRTASHITKTIAHVGQSHQYNGMDEAMRGIQNDMCNYLQSLYDAKAIHDFSASVIRLNGTEISASFAVKLGKVSDFILFPATIHLKDSNSSHSTAFDRAMKGV